MALLAAATDNGIFPVVAVGQQVIALTPASLRQPAVESTGLAHKPLLLAGIVVALLVVSAALGARSRRSAVPALVGFALLAGVGALASAADVRSTAPTVALVSLVPLGVTAAAFLLLGRPGRAAAAARSRQDEARRRAQARNGGVVVPGAGTGRRRFLALGGATVLAAAVADRSAAALLRSTADATARMRAGLALPTPAHPPPPYRQLRRRRRRRPDAVHRTPNDDFYRIDTALTVPQVDPATWSLQIAGMVDRAGRSPSPTSSPCARSRRTSRSACVRNEVGGDLVGNARWQGVLLADVLARPACATAPSSSSAAPSTASPPASRWRSPSTAARR